MTVFVRVEFCIDEVIAWHCVQSIMNKGERVTKAKIIEECRKCFYSNGSVFETSPEFPEDEWIKEVEDEKVQRVFERIWKEQQTKAK
jgi:hypothetical protein